MWFIPPNICLKKQPKLNEFHTAPKIKSLDTELIGATWNNVKNLTGLDIRGNLRTTTFSCYGFWLGRFNKGKAEQ